MSVEAELKFRVSPRKLSSLAKAELAGTRRGAPSEQDRVSTYFDANKHKLKRNGFIKRRLEKLAGARLGNGRSAPAAVNA